MNTKGINSNNKNRIYSAIDLKSFYASVECVERGLDPLTTNLVVADLSRTSKTICLAVTPSLKAYGIPGRARLFEVEQKVNEINALRESQGIKEKLEFIIAPPRMALYMDVSVRIFDIYQKYISPDDVHVYSVDEIFLDLTDYLNFYNMTAEELTMVMIKDVLNNTGITATAGIGTNLYLCKIAMDIVAKHMKPNSDGVRIACLDEMSYRRLLWNHRPITDFWRVGNGYAKKLASVGLYTMGDIARCSIGKEEDFYNEDLLYKMFGINAELLIDHAWGYEPCLIKDIKNYRPDTNSLSVGQVLKRPYRNDEARVVITEMAEHMALDLTKKKLLCNQVVVYVGYDIENINILKNKVTNGDGEIKEDRYGRLVPKHAQGTYNLDEYTNLASKIIEATLSIFDEKTNPEFSIRRMTVNVNHVVIKSRGLEENEKANEFKQMSLFDVMSDYNTISNDENVTDNNVENNKCEKKSESETEYFEHNVDDEKTMQDMMLKIKEKYGKNAILKGTNFKKGATARERNEQIGGHKA